MGHIQTITCFYMVYELKSDFRWLNKASVLWHLEIIWNLNFNIHKVLLEHNHAHYLHIVSVAGSALQQQNWVVATETIGSLWKKFANQCLTKHFNKHVPGIILKVFNVGMGRYSLSSSTDEKTVCMVICFESYDRTSTHLWAFFIHNTQHFSYSILLHLPKRCFSYSQKKTYRKSENYINQTVNEDC